MVSWLHAFVFATVSPFILLANAQQTSGTPPSSWPHVYPGMPNGSYSPEWQDCMLNLNPTLNNKAHRTLTRLRSDRESAKCYLVSRS